MSPLVLLHGFTGTPVMWEPLLPYLREHHEVHVLTIPGHYGGRPIDDPGDNLVDTMISMVEEQLDELGLPKAHIAGNSLGGWMSLLLAGRGRALSTVAIAPAGGWQAHSAETRRAQLLFRRMQISLALTYPLALELAARPRGRKLALAEALAYPERLPGYYAKQWLHAARETPARDLLLRFAGETSTPTELPGAEGPIRIAWGTKDRILPYSRYSTGWRRLLPDADWVTLHGLGHVPMSDDPELVANTILEVTTAFDSDALSADSAAA
ncbi:MAG: alpha/beta fold hydrolase [Actinobacteria bacterium]|nr:alpha/beta fold hydrolase [Actinomycetota bacterium]